MMVRRESIPRGAQPSGVDREALLVSGKRRERRGDKEQDACIIVSRFTTVRIRRIHHPPGDGTTVLSSLNSLLQWLQVYRAFPQERLRIFSSPSREALNEQLARENQGLFSSGVPAPQFLQARRIAPHGAVREATAHVARTHVPTASTPAKPSPFPDESSMSPLDKRREELEHGAGGDHDLPYQFTLPTSLPQVLSWVKLLARVQQGDFQPEVGAFDERQPQHPGGSSTPTSAP
jgi:hypothetical protein